MLILGNGRKKDLKTSRFFIFLLVMNFFNGKYILWISFESIIKEQLIPSGSIFIIARGNFWNENAIIIIIIP